jgi:hypothetical protein
MHYRVESAALPRVRTFRSIEKAIQFAKALAKTTEHEVLIRIVGGAFSINHSVMYIFNKKREADPPSQK